MKPAHLHKLGFALIIIATLVYGVATSRRTVERNSVVTETTNTTNTSPALSSTLTLDEYKEPHLTSAQRETIFTSLADSTKYVPADATDSLLGDCGTSTKVEAFTALQKKLTKQTVNGSFVVLRTPNDLNWSSLEVARAYQNDDTLVCGVGFPYPFEVAADHVLWRTTCSSGLLPVDEQNKLDIEFVQCLQMEEAIEERNAS